MSQITKFPTRLFMVAFPDSPVLFQLWLSHKATEIKSNTQSLEVSQPSHRSHLSSQQPLIATSKWTSRQKLWLLTQEASQAVCSAPTRFRSLWRMQILWQPLWAINWLSQPKSCQVSTIRPLYSTSPMESLQSLNYQVPQEAHFL